MKKLAVTSLLLLGLLASTGVHPAFAQTDTFMLIPGIPGSSTDVKHKGWIDVVSLTQTAEVLATSALGAGLASGTRAQCSLEVVKPLDVAGPRLWEAAVTGQVLGDVLIDVRTQGERPQTIYQIKLQDARIKAITTNGGDQYLERVILEMFSVELAFFQLKPDGTAGGATTSMFSCQGGKR